MRTWITIIVKPSNWWTVRSVLENSLGERSWAYCDVAGRRCLRGNSIGSGWRAAEKPAGVCFALYRKICTTESIQINRHLRKHHNGTLTLVSRYCANSMHRSRRNSQIVSFLEAWKVPTTFKLIMPSHMFIKLQSSINILQGDVTIPKTQLKVTKTCYKLWSSITPQWCIYGFLLVSRYSAESMQIRQDRANCQIMSFLTGWKVPTTFKGHHVTIYVC